MAGPGNLRVVIGMKVVAVTEDEWPGHTGGCDGRRPGVRCRHQVAEPQDLRLQPGRHPVLVEQLAVKEVSPVRPHGEGCVLLVAFELPPAPGYGVPRR